MTDDQAAKVSSWLERKWMGVATCPAGHRDAWATEDTLSFVPGFVDDDKGSRIAHELGHRFVLVTCTACGYVAFVNTKSVGIGP
jgi:hypothetical protein